MILIPGVRAVTALDHEIFVWAQDVLGGVGGTERPQKYLAANGKQQGGGFHGLFLVTGLDVQGVWKTKMPRLEYGAARRRENLRSPREKA